MKLQTKYAAYNALSKIVIISALSVLLPTIIDKVAYRNLDSRLIAKKEKVLSDSYKNGLNDFFQDQAEASLGSYNLLKEEFISIEATPDSIKSSIKIGNAQRMIDEEVFEFRVLSHTFMYNGQNYLLEIGESLGIINSLKKTLTGFTMGLLLIAICIAFLMDIGFTQFLLRPFNSIIQNKLKLVNHPALFNFNKVKTSTDDFGYLDQSINEMMLKIQDAFRIEKEFIANVSHELLTPISILQTRFENIVADETLDDKTKIKLVESQKTLSRLNKIVKTLLLISKIENEQYLKQDVVVMSELIEEVTTEIEERLTAKNITLTTNLEGTYNLMHCNKSLLFMLFFNLINNAIKYNKPDGSILIQGRFNDGDYVVDIIDSGIGIEQNNIGNIFNRFNKINASEKESYGLGLPIVKTIAQFHTIKIKVESVMHEGSTFSLTFPK